MTSIIKPVSSKSFETKEPKLTGSEVSEKLETIKWNVSVAKRKYTFALQCDQRADPKSPKLAKICPKWMLRSTFKASILTVFTL